MAAAEAAPRARPLPSFYHNSGKTVSLMDRWVEEVCQEVERFETAATSCSTWVGWNVTIARQDASHGSLKLRLRVSLFCAARHVPFYS